MDWLRDRIMGRCGVTMHAEDRRRLQELKARTRRAERQTAILRSARERGEWPSWEELYGRQGEPDGR